MADLNRNLTDKINVDDSSMGVDREGPNPSKYRIKSKNQYFLGAKKFVDYADLDLMAAEVLFEVQDRDDYDFMNQAAFLCAQATEKYLKSIVFLILSRKYPDKSGLEIVKKIKDEYSHDLAKLLGECKDFYNEFSILNKEIELLSTYSYLKYPDVEEDLITSDDGLNIDSQEIMLAVNKIKNEVNLILQNNLI